MPCHKESHLKFIRADISQIQICVFRFENALPRPSWLPRARCVGDFPVGLSGMVDVAPCLAGAHNIEVDVQTSRKGDRSGLYDPVRGDRDLRRANF